MSSLFDSAVRERRAHTPWARVSPARFLKEAAMNVPDGAPVRDHEVVLRCHERPDVASRFWWTLEWTGEDSERHVVDSQYQDLLFWRAAEEAMRARARAEAERGEDAG